jgi:VWFA-related protein
MPVHRLVAASACAGVLATGLAAARVDDQQVLRAGAHLVQVDAYPLKNGAPIVGLTAADFELLEDGKPQQIDSVRFLDFPTWTPDQQRRDPNSQRESFALAADPANRLFVIYLNRVPWQLGNLIEPALYDFLDRSMGARDYVAVMTAMQSPGDIAFGQLTTAFKSETRRFLNVVDWADPAYMSPEELELFTCFPGTVALDLISRRRSDDVYRDLEGLVTLLGSIRETKSTLIFVSQGMFDPAEVRQLTTTSSTQPRVLSPGQITPPPAGRGSFPVPGKMVEHSRCEDLRRAAVEPWSSDRFKRLLADARTANVALTPINPKGLVADPEPAVTRAAEHVNDLLRTMASETGGIAVVNLNNMREGFRRVADSLTSHYLLGYYSTNRNTDGRIRRITVKLKANGDTIRARREYRAPNAAESAPTPSPPAIATVNADLARGLQMALSALEREDRDDPNTSVRRPLDPLMPRLSRAASPPAAPWQPVTRRQFSRTERLRLEWTVPAGAAGGSSIQLRVLSRDGRPLPVAIEQSNDPTSGGVTAIIRLAPFAPGLYVIEATLPDGAVQYVAFRIA